MNKKEINKKIKNSLILLLTIFIVVIFVTFIYLIFNYKTDSGKTLNSENSKNESKYSKHITKEEAEKIAKETIEKSERIKKLLNNNIKLVKISNSETKKETKKTSNMYANNEPYKINDELKEVWNVKSLVLGNENSEGTGFEIFVDYYTGEIVGGETEINCY